MKNGYVFIPNPPEFKKVIDKYSGIDLQGWCDDDENSSYDDMGSARIECDTDDRLAVFKGIRGDKTKYLLVDTEDDCGLEGDVDCIEYDDLDAAIGAMKLQHAKNNGDEDDEEEDDDI